jgi:hypothetical protein
MVVIAQFLNLTYTLSILFPDALETAFIQGSAKSIGGM